MSRIESHSRRGAPLTIVVDGVRVLDIQESPNHVRPTWPSGDQQQQAHLDLQVADIVAAKVVQKYQSMTCEQLWAQKAQPKSAEEQRVMQFLRDDPQMRTAFFNKVSGPIVNKMFECGMIP